MTGVLYPDLLGSDRLVPRRMIVERMELTEDDALRLRASAYPEPEKDLDHLSHLFIQDPGGVDAAFDQIEQTVNSDPYLALTQCSLISGVISTAASKALNLTKRLSNAISRLQTIVAGIVQQVKATSFTITVCFPVAVSIGVTWSSSPHSGDHH